MSSEKKQSKETKKIEKTKVKSGTVSNEQLKFISKNLKINESDEPEVEQDLSKARKN